MDTSARPEKQQEAAQALPSSAVPLEQLGTVALRKTSNIYGLTSFRPGETQRNLPNRGWKLWRELSDSRPADSGLRRPCPKAGASALWGGGDPLKEHRS